MTKQEQSEEFWTKDRLELRAWFRRHAASLGELYEGALKMIFSDDFPGRTRLISHAVREIRNRLPVVITGSKGSYFQWKNRLDQLVVDWKKEGFALDGKTSTSVDSEQQLPSSSFTMPRILVEKIAMLLKDHCESRETSTETATRLFMGVSSCDRELVDSLRPQTLRWLDVTEWFVKKVHDSGAMDKDFDIQEFRRYFERFELTLGALLNGFFRTKEGLDAILEDTNSTTN
jgi:hypothetical protein